MSNTAIKVEDLGKLYKLGEISTGTISHDLKRWWAAARGKEDPYAKIGTTNDRTVKGDGDYVWALKDVNFEIKQGEAVGIIGRNGAGKSTLLKLLSKVTAPSTGLIKVKGRIASLLEVGTGFHPELTGRENIFLNGAILGMTKSEIKSKFDEIVDFSGVERYIDTPVKRYSSGMYVRLAFAVAAHLESEILIVDEVLAVGDSEFQQKCLGKMKDVSGNSGKTVLFVSHQLGTISQLCNKSLLLNKGQVQSYGATSKIIDQYLNQATFNNTYVGKEDNPSDIFILSAQSRDETDNSASSFGHQDQISIKIKGRINSRNKGVLLALGIKDSRQRLIFTNYFNLDNLKIGGEKGDFDLIVKLPVHLLVPGIYCFTLALHIPNNKLFDVVDDTCFFEIIDQGSDFTYAEGSDYGCVFVNCEWIESD